VGLQYGGDPRRSAAADWLVRLVAENQGVDWLLLAVGIEAQPVRTVLRRVVAIGTVRVLLLFVVSPLRPFEETMPLFLLGLRRLETRSGWLEGSSTI